MDKQPEALELADLFEIGNFALHRAAAAELRRLHQHEIANNEWWGKTEWVQETCKSHELGMHRADVLKQRIDRLHQVNQEFEVANYSLLVRLIKVRNLKIELVEALGDMVFLFTPAAKDCTAANLIDKAEAILAKHKESNNG